MYRVSEHVAVVRFSVNDIICGDEGQAFFALGKEGQIDFTTWR
jgi:hypothetical protein